MTLLTIGIEGKSHDTGSVSTIDAKVKAWMVKAAQADYQAIQKMLREDKELARQKVRIWSSLEDYLADNVRKNCPKNTSTTSDF